jgi:L-alanine-DL-glutamate epimerase-like enolase superfamily enzyme
MRRRDFLTVLPVAAAASAVPAMPAMAAVPPLTGARIKITDIRIVRLKVIKEVGSFAGFMGPEDTNTVRIGGGSFIEVHTDQQGLVGIGPGIDPATLAGLRAELVGRDPFEIQILVANLRGTTGLRRIKAAPPSSFPIPAGAPIPYGGGATGAERTYSAAEIALWDLIGKALNAPLYRLWGAVTDRVAPYASEARLGTPEERAELALRLKGDGWRAIKYRAHFQTMKEDIRLVELARKAVGEDMDIMCDANQAGNGPLTQTVKWDFRRALQTARAYEELNVYWLEEPLPRYDYDHLAELNRLVALPLAGGEQNRGLNEFRDLLERGCFDIVQPEVLIEGPLSMRKIAVLAESMNRQIVPHVADGNIGTVCNMHLVASWPNAPYIEIYHDLPLDEYSNNFAIFEEPPVLDKNGYFAVPQKPGLGISINKDFILSG